MHFAAKKVEVVRQLRRDDVFRLHNTFNCNTKGLGFHRIFKKTDSQDFRSKIRAESIIKATKVFIHQNQLSFSTH